MVAVVDPAGITITAAELAAECDVKGALVKCIKPYVRKSKITKGAALSFENRDAVTPFGCGQCLPCRINKAREWTARILIEDRMHEHSCFLTLTYDDEHIPHGRTLVPRHLQLFIKRLRKDFEPRKIRYFAVGEYGVKNTKRPHYHIIVFGGEHSEVLEYAKKNWKYCDPDVGIDCGFLNKDSARYITGYVVKKLNKSHRDLGDRYPEFARMSLRPGIGAVGIDNMAKNIIHRGSYLPESPVRELQIEKRKLPLGRYLSDRINKGLNISEGKKVDSYTDYQKNTFLEYGAFGEFYLANLTDEARKKEKVVKHNLKNSKQRKL